ncbi:type II toxin-antitoxin system RelB family antitoxin [Candidatus Odyssella acanthamoebae]|uniref:Anti-toxin n=1 Tax=Candidatus Odyssella acanthamoebae TaxID=91604 RepID=A0A077AX73_9PROT|nr:ribbon-helix-helix domain-containing protein [Candidatus Paracaedibacter acanthamoebae]AIK96579.1 anti-toxin [Candidatus Paracaedibacter acanthamoebae]
MLGVRLSKELDDRLKALAEKTNRSKSYYVKKAIEQFLDDQEDYLAALAVYEKKGRRYSAGDVEQLFDELKKDKVVP